MRGEGGGELGELFHGRDDNRGCEGGNKEKERERLGVSERGRERVRE